MKMVLKELELYTGTLEKVKLSISSSLSSCSDKVKLELTKEKDDFCILWDSVRTRAEACKSDFIILHYKL